MPAPTSAAAASSLSVLPTPAKSSNDKKDYRVIRLGNGIRALLISDTSYPLDKLAEEEAANSQVSKGEHIIQTFTQNPKSSTVAQNWR